MNEWLLPSGACTAGALMLDVARGNLRDSLGGLRNLAQLLHSIRVAPKSLSAVLPDVHASVGSMRHALEQLLHGLRPRLCQTNPLPELREFFTPRLDALDSELRVAMARAVTAKSRLRLEQILLRLTRELDTARGLVDLLVEAASRPSIEVNLGDLVQHAFSTVPSPALCQTRTLKARLAAETRSVELKINPHVVTQLCILGVELVSQSPGSGEPCIRFGLGDGCEAVLLVDREAGPALRQVEFTAPGLIDPTVACVEAAAQLSNAELKWVPKIGRFCIRWAQVTEAARSREAS